MRALLFTALALAVLGGADAGCKKHPPAGPRPKLELAEAADDQDAFRDFVATPPVEVRSETVGHAHVTTHYAALAFPADRDPRNAERELRAAVGTVTLPPDTRLAFGPDEGGERASVRTWLLRGAPVLTEADVQGAEASEDEGMHRWSVLVTLTPRGASAFEAYTKSHVGKRIAIVVEGVVQSVPVVQSAIAGGRLSITLGSELGSTPDEARRLAAAFGGPP